MDYIVRFYCTAIGCSNLVPPEDTWLRRNENETMVGCYTSHQTWHLRCMENKWSGVIGNCTRGKIDFKFLIHILLSISIAPTEAN